MANLHPVNKLTDMWHPSTSSWYLMSILLE